MRWDLFCRVIDNHGDLGVSWRLACGLAAAGDSVSLWVDDARALSWMAPRGAQGVEVRAWTATTPFHTADVADVVVETFGCELPTAFVQSMVRRQPAPVWVNLEYLSAEGYVDRSHGLPSPRPSGLATWFFYPGFSERSGGLLREPGLMQQQAGFDGRDWLARHGWAPRAGERVMSLFCYTQPGLEAWLPLLATAPTLLLATPGPATEQLRALKMPGALRVIELPWLSQPDYDRLLWACDLNAVRGEDSLVRALWAPAPLLWQLYPQHDGVLARKLDAFLVGLLQDAAPPLAAPVRQTQRHWNGLAPLPASLPDLAAWGQVQQLLRARLLMQDDLVTQLRRFVHSKSG